MPLIRTFLNIYILAVKRFLILDGIFSEGMRDYPAGWYLRNPPGSSHQPFSTIGARIFVKLSHMENEERLTTRINTNHSSKWTRSVGRSICSLYENEMESTYLLLLKAGMFIQQDTTRNFEVLILKGVLLGCDMELPAGSWLRLPRSRMMHLTAGTNGAMLYIKSNKAG